MSSAVSPVAAATASGVASSRPRAPSPSRPSAERGEPPGLDPSFGEQHLEQREQQERIGARANGEMPVGHGGGLGAPWVHDHEPPSSRAQGLEPPLDAGRGHEAAVRGQGVGAEHEEELGTVHVGHRQQELVSEHEVRRQHVRELVHGSGGVAAARAQRLQEDLARTRWRRGCGPWGCRGRSRPHSDRGPSGSRAASPPPPASASSKDTSCHPEVVRRSGRRRRSGSWCTSWRATAFGQMCPALKGSSLSPAIRVIWPASSTSMAMPHMASQRWQARKCVRMAGSVARRSAERHA